MRMNREEKIQDAANSILAEGGNEPVLEMKACMRHYSSE